jgi:hypothetical protein
MDVMTASVHDRHLGAVGTGRGYLACIRQPGRLPDRESVHVGTQQDGRAFAVAQDRHDAGTAHTGVYLTPGGSKSVGHIGRRTSLLV